ncbi:MAG: hypothetical protein ACHQK9_15525 [Reyranellales bacterium]
MTKYPLEWGWEQSDTPNTSTVSEWKPKPTLLSGDGTELAAVGDLRCEACPSGGTWGTTGAYKVENTIMCRECAVKRLGIENLPGSEQNKILKNFELMSR